MIIVHNATMYVFILISVNMLCLVALSEIKFNSVPNGEGHCSYYQTLVCLPRFYYLQVALIWGVKQPTLFTMWPAGTNTIPAPSCQIVVICHKSFVHINLSWFFLMLVRLQYLGNKLAIVNSLLNTSRGWDLKSFRTYSLTSIPSGLSNADHL